MKTFIDAFERIPCRIFEQQDAACTKIAAHIASRIAEKRKLGQSFILGLATGASPIKIYAELVNLYKQKKVSFSNVIALNLDEYYPINQNDDGSYYYFLQEHLLQHVDINPQNVFLHQGDAEKKNLKTYCRAFEEKIKSLGGIDLQILGVGHNGHIGFNEPGSSYFSKTRLISLSESSRIANSIYFATPQDVPRLAITMGISTIMQAQEIILVAWGASKAKVIQLATEEQPTEQVPASLLQQHDHAVFYLDNESASELTRNKRPWLTGNVDWTQDMIKKAVIHMALQLKKPILSLTYDDYVHHGLMDLFIETGRAYFDINLEIFHLLRHSITGWPGGKAGSSTINKHPERPTPTYKKVIIFSPHPDDDIISMGGTMQRLHDHGHEVHVGYQTSGNVAVSDSFVLRLINFVNGFEEVFDIHNLKTKGILDEVVSFLKTKKRNQMDSQSIRIIKGLIRKYEALATCNYVGLENNRAHFLNLPFYETGKIEKKPLSQKDIDITKEMLRKIKPHQIFAAGDLADPHGTHKTCLDIIMQAVIQIKEEKDDWINNCWVWMYKGAWQEWEIEEIEMAIPMSPEQVLSKRNAIFIHQSQKDDVPFPGSDKREFWERAEERNANMSSLYAQLGLPKYTAVEAFVRWHF